MAYFSRGRAHLGVARDIDEARTRYYWFQRIAESLYGPDLDAPPAAAALAESAPGTATVDFFFTSESVSGMMALVSDSDIGAWWDALGAATTTDEHDNRRVNLHAVRSSPATLVTLEHDPSEYEMFHGRATLEAGAYLVCWLVGAIISVCAYEEFPAGSRTYLNPVHFEFAHYLRNIRNFDPQR